MKIKITSIDENVVNGTDPLMCDAVQLMNKVLQAQAAGTKELWLEIADEVDSIGDVFLGLYRYIQRIKYMGSKGVVENLTNLLGCEDNTVLRDTLRQWKEAEEMMWEVIPAKEED